MEFEFEFEGAVIEWRGPAPFYFVPMPLQISEEVKKLARTLSYGWGVVPVKARVGGVDFTTSLIPHNGVFHLPLKAVVWRPNGIEVGDIVSVWVSLGGR